MKPKYLFLAAAALLGGISFFSCTGVRKPPASDLLNAAVKNEFGTVITIHAESAPFPHPSRNQGYAWEDSFFPYHPHYDNSKVSIFVPKRFRPSFSTDVVVFFHGWYGSIDTIPSQFSLYRQFNQSRANAIFVLPQGPWNAPDSFGGKFEDKGGFEAFIREILAKLDDADVLRNDRLGNVVILAHSGAYHAVSKILANRDLDGKIKEVCMFDALFGSLTPFGEWLMRRKGRFIALYSRNGETEANTEALMQMLASKGIRYKAVPDNSEFDRKLRRGNILFMDSPNDHYGILFQSDEIRRLLAQSAVLRHYIIN